MNLKDALKAFLVYLQPLLKEAVIKKIFGKAIGGLKLWLTTYVFKKVYAVLSKPIYAFLRTVRAWSKAKESKKESKRIDDAKNQDDFDDAVNDLLN